MTLIESQDIEIWGTRQEAKGKFPLVIARLVRETATKISKISFPSGKDTFIGGWDGIVHSTEATSFVPKGVSYWELGTEQNPESKAEKDYKKRKENEEGYDLNNSTLVIVTTRLWKDKDEWVKEKMKDEIFGDIKVYDSRDLQLWFDEAIVATRTFASFIRKYPSDGIQLPEDFWDEWATGPRHVLLPSIITSGREFEIEQLKQFLENPPSILAIRSKSKKESLAFIIASSKQLEIQPQENFFSRGLIINSTHNFRSIRNNQHQLILIPRFDEDMEIVHYAVSKGHHVIIPLGPEEPYHSKDIFTLHPIDRDGLIKSLIEIGISEEEAKRFSKESGRDITILRRLLSFYSKGSFWSLGKEADVIIPALIAGRWDENKEGDKVVLSHLSGKEYSTYISELSAFENVEDFPLYHIGDTWRLISPLDAWTNNSTRLTSNDFIKAQKIIIDVLRTVNPAFDLEPEKRYMAGVYGKNPTYSSWLREGLAQSLILIALFGDELKLPIKFAPNIWVDNTISDVFKDAEGKLWSSLNPLLPLIAEASPNGFFQFIEESLNTKDQAIMEMFKEEPSMLFNHSHHTGLLWALESLAWIPEFLPRATLNLGALAQLDPGGNLANRPINSLRSIFLPWLPQTYADLTKRLESLELLIPKEREVAWKLLNMLLPKHHDVGHPTHKTRWRLFNEQRKVQVTNREFYKNHLWVVEHLIPLSGKDEVRLSELVDNISVQLLPQGRLEIISYLKQIAGSLQQENFALWNKLRHILHHHRSFSKTDWTLPKLELDQLEEVYNLLTPVDTLLQNEWLFTQQWPDFPEGRDHETLDHNQEEEIIRDRRISALKKIVDEYGIGKLGQLIDSLKEPWIIGDIAGYIIDNSEDIHNMITQDRLNSNSPGIQSFIFRKERLQGFSWVDNFFHDFADRGYSEESLASFIVPVLASQNLFDLLEKQTESLKKFYWMKVYPRLYDLSLSQKIYVIENLLDVNRSGSIINNIWTEMDELPTDLIVKVLDLLPSDTSEQRQRIADYEIEKIFELLYQRKDLPENVLARLEWMYLSVLSHSYGRHKEVKVLHKELSSDPKFFVDVLKWMYKPSNQEAATEEIKDLTTEEIQRRAEQAFRLLSSWHLIPGINESGEIDLKNLNEWIRIVRDLAKEAHRLEAADVHIGKLFAHYPEKSDQWPPDAIAEIIDNLNSESMKRNFKTEIFNKRGTYSKAVYEGGDQERKLAEKYYGYSQIIASKFPITSSLLEKLGDEYAFDAKREDEDAQREELEQ